MLFLRGGLAEAPDELERAATGNVRTMFPVPITGSQGPQSFNGSSGSGFIPASASTSSGNLTGSDQNGFTPTAAGTASGSPSSSMK